LPFGQREIQKGGVTSDRRLTAGHLGRYRSDMFPGRRQLPKKHVFVCCPWATREAHFLAFSLPSLRFNEIPNLFAIRATF
jgi:hypothetical protein